jgi:hypothetical protein
VYRAAERRARSLLRQRSDVLGHTAADGCASASVSRPRMFSGALTGRGHRSYSLSSRHASPRPRCRRARLMGCGITAPHHMPHQTPHTPASDLPRSALAVFSGGEWRPWWHPDSAPPRWRDALPLVGDAVTRRSTASDGVEWGGLRLSGAGEAWRLRVILARDAKPTACGARGLRSAELPLAAASDRTSALSHSGGHGPVLGCS